MPIQNFKEEIMYMAFAVVCRNISEYGLCIREMLTRQLIVNSEYPVCIIVVTVLVLPA